MRAELEAAHGRQLAQLTAAHGKELEASEDEGRRKEAGVQSQLTSAAAKAKADMKVTAHLQAA